MNCAHSYGWRPIDIVDIKNFYIKDTHFYLALFYIVGSSSKRMNQNFKNFEEGIWFLSLSFVFIQYFHSINLKAKSSAQQSGLNFISMSKILKGLSNSWFIKANLY